MGDGVQSDDNSLKVWNTEDWSLKVSVEAPFVNAPKATTVRPSWSPEGTHIATPNSMSGKVFVAGVIERSSWKSDISMVGHEDIVTSTVSKSGLQQPCLLQR
jgi:protein HIRA/HIR1